MVEIDLMDTLVSDLIAREQLPETFRTIVEQVYVPLADAIAKRVDDKPVVVGINGAQGTGKSTLAVFLGALLESRHRLSVVSFSLDDIYRTKSERLALAADVHPLLATRGVPGTHDIGLGSRILKSLQQAGPDTVTLIPRFDKANDDRCSENQWTRFRGRPQVVIVEGWCLGARPQTPAALEQPVNDLEAKRDGDGSWRRYVNDQLAGLYAEFHRYLDLLVMLKAPDWDSVYHWRLLQEEKLRNSRHKQAAAAIMTAEEVANFIQYYERLTRHQLREMPERADAVIALDDDHRVAAVDGPLLKR